MLKVKAMEKGGCGMLHKRLWLLVGLCLLLLPVGAAAASGGIANQVPMLYVSDSWGPADALMDDSAETVWQGAVNPAADAPTWTILTASRTVKEVWLRTGARESLRGYLAAGRPALVAVTVYYENQQVSTYRYRLSDAYAQDNTRDWVDGYQRLLLPQAMNGVFCIELRVLESIPGEVTAEVAVADILLSSGQPSPPSSGKEMRASAPTVSPATATMPPISGGTGGGSPTNPPSGGGSSGGSPTGAVTATLKERIGTRTGPGTEYDYVGSFFQGGEQVQVISKVWDSENELYWFLLDFTAGGVHYRGYAVNQRVNLDPSQVPSEAAGVSASIVTRTGNSFGPGSDYKQHTDKISVGTKGTIYAWENGYALFEWYDSYQGVKRRAWIPEDTVTWSGK